MSAHARNLTLAAAVILFVAAPAAADKWNERLSMAFSEPVMVPGATLPPGKYVFELLESKTNREIVRILKEADESVVVTAQAIPVKRAERSGDAVLRFNPSDTSAPPAIKAWFYPGTQYGHEFVYPEEQARHIADRTKTVVLAVDVPGSDAEKGILWTLNPSGDRTKWAADPATQREWEEWRRASASSDADERAKASAVSIRSDFKAPRASLADVEANPDKFLGQRISVDGEVEEIYGPRLFTIDEPGMGDLDREILVFVPSPLAVLIKDNDRVTIAGTLKPFVKTDMEVEWGWQGVEEMEREVSRRPVLVAEHVVGGDNNRALIIGAPEKDAKAVGTAGAAPLNDPAAVAHGGADLVGRSVMLEGLRVSADPAGSGFFVDVNGQHVYVLPAVGSPQFTVGSTVGVNGVVMQMPSSMVKRLDAPGAHNNRIYIFANSVSK